jgi:hypothetical protein
VSGFPGVPADWGNEREHRRKLAESLNRVLAGKLNAALDVTLAANAAATTVADARLSSASYIGFCPLTANAAAEIGSGTIYVSAQGKGTATLAHANNAQTDRNFRLLVIG